MVSNKLYIEGGGNRRHQVLRRAFSAFFERAGFQGRLPRIVAGGDRNSTYRGFCRALENAGQDDFVALLVDAESAVEPGATTGWDHLRERQEDQWARPAGADDDQVHLMVECMEAWLLADRTCLATYFGRGFDAGNLPGQRNDVEAIPKDDLITGLENATRDTEKGTYDKGAHSFEILEMLDPELVCNASRHARRLIDVLHEKL